MKIIITESQLDSIVLYESKEEQEKEEFKKPTFEELNAIKYNNDDGKHILLITFSVASVINLCKSFIRGSLAEVG